MVEKEEGNVTRVLLFTTFIISNPIVAWLPWKDPYFVSVTLTDLLSIPTKLMCAFTPPELMPQLNTLQDIPSITLVGEEDYRDLVESLKVSTGDVQGCAVAGRLWEQLLEKHRIPFLLILVADLRYVLNSKILALDLYAEVCRLHYCGLSLMMLWQAQKTLDVSAFAEWILEETFAVKAEITRDGMHSRTAVRITLICVSRG